MKPILKEDILSGKLNGPDSPAVLLVMPGGADLPYCRDLNGLGCKNIRSMCFK